MTSAGQAQSYVVSALAPEGAGPPIRPSIFFRRKRVALQWQGPGTEKMPENLAAGFDETLSQLGGKPYGITAIFQRFLQ